MNIGDAIPVNANAVKRAALTGFVMLVIGTVVGEIADAPVVAGSSVLAAMLVAGLVAGFAAPDEPLTNGMLSAELAWIAWIPVRIIIWQVHPNGHELITGDDPALPIGGMFLTAVFAGGIGMLGSMAGGRWARRRGARGGAGSGGTADGARS